MWALEQWYAGEGWRVIAFFKTEAGAKSARLHLYVKNHPVRVVYV